MAKKGEIKKTAEQYEAEFHGLELPESFYVAPGAFVPNTREFLEKSLYILKTGRERVAEPVRWRLEVLLKLIREKEATEE